MNGVLRLGVALVIATVAVYVFYGRQRATAAETAPPPAERVGTARPDDATLRATLSELQYRVTQEDATEPPFRNPYHDEKRDGIYVDVVSGEALFSSRDKYDSGTGWPSFTRPLEPDNVYTRTDRLLAVERTEVRSVGGDSHLGHVFADGPAPTGLRYCMNSAALRFIPADSLAEAGYGEYASLFGRDSARAPHDTGDTTP